MPVLRNRIFYFALGTGWAVAVAFGLSRLWAYSGTPDAPGVSPREWPTGSMVSRAADRPTLVLFVHPHCPCSRATIGELAKLMTDCGDKLSATVVFLQPDGSSPDWEKTDLWDSAAAIPRVTVSTDRSGHECLRFGAATSGQALLYSSRGQLLFAGGITESRGHSGDNAGRSAITSLILGTGPANQTAATPVFGCPLFNRTAHQPTEGMPVCHLK